MSAAGDRQILTMTHWGVYRVTAHNGRLTDVQPWSGDPDPSPIGRSLLAVDHPRRIRQPMVRESWLRHGPGNAAGDRGRDSLLPVTWNRALDLVAAELARVRATYGNEAIYAGSYGWSSAGRFHHAQGQLHRFMSLAGGYTGSVNTYSLAAAEVIVPRVLGYSYNHVQAASTSLPVTAKHTTLLVCFGGIALKNAQVNAAGLGRHRIRGWLRQAKRNGCRFVNLSPVRDDLAPELDAEWLALRPNTDTAVMLGLAHTLVTEGHHDQSFLSRYCTGFEAFRDYLKGNADGQPKNAQWAAAISGLPAQRIRTLAREMAAQRTMINASWSLQRADHGEQPYWMAITLAALLGQIGLPGGGFTLGYGAVGSVGNGAPRLKLPSLPRLPNPVRRFIPVARISDMLLQPGTSFSYDGARYTYPDIRLVYWAGGNPFHHHQDLNRLRRAWQRPETVIVQDPFWTATARHADVVLPATTPLERDDIGGASQDNVLVAMKQALAPVGEACDDYTILAGLAERLGIAERFTEGRSAHEWLRYLYGQLRQRHTELPDFDSFWAREILEFDETLTGPAEQLLLADFRTDPHGHPLPTVSGRIELYSEAIAGLNLPDCPPHAAWLEPAEWLGAPLAQRFPLHLLSNQPATRLHSQWEHGATSQTAKIGGREALCISPSDATARGIRDGDTVRVFNQRGQCLAGARVTATIRPGVVTLATGAPFQPEGRDDLEQSGNPNVLTRDVGTSALAQGPSAQTCLVDVVRYPATTTLDRDGRSAARY